MKLEIRLFGIACDIAGSRVLDWEVEEGVTVKQVKQQLTSHYPSFSDLKSIAFAVNESYVDDTYELKNNDELVIIPPVSGG